MQYQMNEFLFAMILTELEDEQARKTALQEQLTK